MLKSPVGGKASSLRLALWVAMRHIVSARKKSGLSFMTKISILGVTIGVMALIVVLSVMGGFEEQLKKKMLRGQPHVEVVNHQSIVGFGLKDYPLSYFEKLFPEALAIEPFTQSDVVLKRRKHLSAVSLVGLNAKKQKHLWGFTNAMVDGKMQMLDRPKGAVPGVILGLALAGQLNADIGDEIQILSPQVAVGSNVISAGTISRSYEVVGLFQTGIATYDGKWAITNLEEGRRFLTDYDPSLDEDEFVTGVAFNLPDPEDASVLQRRLVGHDTLALKSWMDTNASLLFALQLEKYTMGFILMLIVLVAAFSISGTMMMTVFHKKNQVCLLRSLGMAQKDIRNIFLLKGTMIGLAGTMLGLVVGLLICMLLAYLRAVDWSYQYSFLGAWPIKYLPLEYGVILLAALGLALVGTTYPAMLASRQSPSEGLR